MSQLTPGCRSPSPLESSDPPTRRVLSLPPPTPVDRVVFVPPVPSSVSNLSHLPTSGPLRFSATFPFPFYNCPVDYPMASQTTPGPSAPPRHYLPLSLNSPTLTSHTPTFRLDKGKQPIHHTPVLNPNPLVFRPSPVFPHQRSRTPLFPPSPSPTSLDFPRMPPSASNPLRSPYTPPHSAAIPTAFPAHSIPPPLAFAPVPPVSSPTLPMIPSTFLPTKLRKVDLPDVSKLPVLSSS